MLMEAELQQNPGEIQKKTCVMAQKFAWEALQKRENGMKLLQHIHITKKRERIIQLCRDVKITCSAVASFLSQSRVENKGINLF